MALTLSCAFTTGTATPDHVAMAESLGYRRAWLYDSPALHGDVWMTLGRCADRTTTIGLGPGVLIPSLRHPMVTAAAIAGLVDLVGQDRVAVAVGTGFTGRLAMGQKPLRWAYVGEYVRVLRALLAGDVVDWDGAKIQMLHPPGFAAPRPIDVPILLGAAGPKGVATAKAVGDGLFVSDGSSDPAFSWVANLFFGTVLRDGEDPSSERVMAAGGPALAVAYHFWWAAGRPMEQLPHGKEWEAGYAEVPADVRHLAVHDQHLIALNDRDRAFITPEFVAAAGAFRPDQLRERVAKLEAGGVTEVAYQPAGPDIPGELETFARAMVS